MKESMTMQNLEGKVAFITGGGSGVALGQAKVFAEEARMKVAIADIRRNHLDEALAHFSRHDLPVHAIELDITDRSAYARAADEAERVLGPVELLCNTAGVSQFGPVEKATYDDWDWQLDVNLKGMINGVQTFLPRMIAHGSGGYSESLRIELEKHGIGVSLLCPGGAEVIAALRQYENDPDYERRKHLGRRMPGAG
jgi:NAD(P)-dependent dehydrogenase (short-subunit alcohol dehydrogenase family)